MITGRCRPAGPTPTRARAVDRRMLTLKIASHGKVIHRARGRQHPMGHAAAEPKPARLVQIARVAHAMPERVAVGDLCRSVRFQARAHTPG